MKKLTLLVLMLFGVVSFAQQTTLKGNGEDNPTRYDQQQKTNSAVLTESQRNAESEIKNLGENMPNYKVSDRSKATTTGTRSTTPVQSATFQEDNTPINAGRQTTVPTEQDEILADELYRASLPIGFAAPAAPISNRPNADFIPTAGATETFTPAVGDHFFDPGGPGGGPTGGTPGNYPNCGCATQTTLAGVSEIEFLFFSVFATFDYLRIYDGTDATGTLLYDNGSGGPNQGDITLAEMIASNGSATFNAASGNFFFYFHASSVVDYGGWDVEITETGGGGGPFPLPYCGPISYSSDVEPITNVEVAGISNRTSGDINGTPAHEDFTAIVGSMEEGETYTISLEGNTNGSFTCSFTVFIDWNQDGVLDNASERYEIGTINNSNGNDGKMATSTITVPAGVVEGQTRMRVMKRFGSTYAPDSCTGGSGWGQAEDYTVDVTAGGGTGTVCATPLSEVNQDVDDTCMANISQGGIAQTYIPLEAEAAGAGIKFRDPSNGLDVNLSLWDGLPNAGGTMLTSGTSQTDGTVWADVLWDPVVNVTVGDTYYIVIDGDVTLPCISGSTNNPYAGGMTFANNYTAFPDFDYTFRTFSCDSGGGTSYPCNTTALSNNMEDGKSFTKNLGRIVANDITVADGENMLLESINFSAFVGGVGSGVNADNVDVFIYEDSGSGSPGALLTSQLSVVPTAQNITGDNFGYQLWSIDLDIADVSLPGQEGATTTYWVGLSLEPTDGSNTFWEYSSAGVIGYGLGYNDGTGFVMEPANEGVYSFSATCESIGGSTGDPCDITGLSNNMEDGKSFTKNLGRIVANDITVADDGDMMLETINFSAFIGSVGSGVNADNVDVFIYEDSGSGSPGALLTSQLSVIPTAQNITGDNFGYQLWSVDLDINDVNLPGQAGSTTTYWVGLSLEPTDGSNTFWEYSSAGVIGYGLGYNDGTGFVIEPANEGVYVFAGTCSSSGSGPANDNCSDAIALSCGDTVTGSTTTATDSGGNAAPDVYYKYTGSGVAELVTISLCGGGTDYDSLLRVFDACDLTNEIAMNDDFCDLQSELTFESDGTSTYYIMVEGFDTESGNFSLAITCETLGISDNKLEGFTYYPNPTTGILNLESRNTIEMVNIYNLLGQKVLTHEVSGTSANLDISGLSDGTYLMEATVNGQVGVYKIVKM